MLSDISATNPSFLKSQWSVSFLGPVHRITSQGHNKLSNVISIHSVAGFYFLNHFLWIIKMIYHDKFIKRYCQYRWASKDCYISFCCNAKSKLWMVMSPVLGKNAKLGHSGKSLRRWTDRGKCLWNNASAFISASSIKWNPRLGLCFYGSIMRHWLLH